MADLTEKQARAILAELGMDPDAGVYRAAEDWPGFPTTVSPLSADVWARVPYWRIVQRAAAEGGEK